MSGVVIGSILGAMLILFGAIRLGKRFSTRRWYALAERIEKGYDR